MKTIVGRRNRIIEISLFTGQVCEKRRWVQCESG